MTHDSAPHERVVVVKPVSEVCFDILGSYVPQTTYELKNQDVKVTVTEVPADWPDDDGPVTATERWALAIMRKIPFGQVTVCSRDGEIERLQVNLTLKPGESWPA